MHKLTIIAAALAAIVFAAWSLSASQTKQRLFGETELSRQTQVFGLAGRGTKFVYVLDRSGSMAGEVFDRARQELIKSIGVLTDSEQISLITYNDEPTLAKGPGDNKAPFATSSNKQLAKEFLAKLVAEGGTQHASALLMAVDLQPSVIFLLTDGHSGGDLAEATLNLILSKNTSRARINVLQFNDPQPPGTNNLVLLAERSGGKHLYVDLKKLMAKGRTRGK